MTDHELRYSLGAYALGTLEPADQQRVEAHLATCPVCLAELTELDSVVPALASLTPDDLAPPAPSPDLFSRIVSAVDASEMPSERDADGPVVPIERARSARFRSRRWLVSVAAAVVVVAGGGTAIGIAVSSSSSSSATTVASGTNGAVHLRVAATDSGSGTRLELTAKGLHAHEHCHLFAFTADGTRHDAGTWDASYEGHATVTESTDVPRSQIQQYKLYGDNGRRLVTVEV